MLESEEIKPDPLIIIKDEKYTLKEVPGIGPATQAKLKKAGINTVQDLINCNSKTTASRIKGIGEVGLNKWKQAARQILYG